MTSLTSSAPLAPIAYPRVSGDNESNALPPPPPLDPKHDPTTDPENKDENQVVDSKEQQDELTDQEPLARSAIRLPLCSRLTPTPLRLSPSRPRTFPTSSTK